MPRKFSRLPLLPELRARFIPDFDAGVLHPNPSFHKKGFSHRRECGCIKKDGRVVVVIDGKHYFSSRVLWAMHTGRDPGHLVIDHIDGDPSNNSISNLRAITSSENRINCKATSNSGHKGIYARTRRDGSVSYTVQLCRQTGEGPKGEKGSRDGITRKTYHYGSFNTIEEAKAKYAEVIADWGLEDVSRAGTFEPAANLPFTLPDKATDETVQDFFDYIGLGAKKGA